MNKLLFLLPLLILSCTKENTEQKPVQTTPSQRIKITAVNSVPLRTIGQVKYSSSNQYHLPITGMIDSIYVSKKDTIQQGDTLLSLRHESIQAQERLQRVILSAALKDKKRISTLFQKGARTALEKEKAEQKHQLEYAKLQKLQAEKDLQFLRAVQPGIVTSISTSSGSYVKASDTLLEIQSGNQVIAFEIPRVWAQVDLANSTITAQFPGDTLVEIKTVSIDSTVTNKSVRITAPVSLDNQLGMNCAVTLHAEMKNIFLISDFGTNDFKSGDLVNITSTEGNSTVCRIISANNYSIYVQGNFTSHVEYIESRNSVQHF